MPDLGNRGTCVGLKTIGGVGALQSFPGLQCIRMGHETLLVRLTKSTTEGDAAVPSMWVRGPYRKSFLWPVDAGTRTISVRCKYSPDVASRRPSLVVKANSEIGVTEQTSSAPSGTGWVTIGPITITPSSDGVVEVELRFDHMHEYEMDCYIDDIEVT
jgi:hypothetical protein